MNYIIRVYFENTIYGIDLSLYKEASIGSGNDTVKLNASGLKINHILFRKKKDNWIIKSKHLSLYNGNGDIPVSSSKIEDGDRYYINTDPVVYISILPKQEDSRYALSLSGLKTVTMGRKPTSNISYDDNSIVLKDGRTSREHCVIYKENNSYYIEDLGSLNGTFVNNNRLYLKDENRKWRAGQYEFEKNTHAVAKHKLINNDIIDISIYQMIFIKDVLFFYNTGNGIEFNVPCENIIDAKETMGILSGEGEETLPVIDKLSKKKTIDIDNDRGTAPIFDRLNTDFKDKESAENELSIKKPVNKNDNRNKNYDYGNLEEGSIDIFK